jgi:hypothetical protein
MRGPPRSTHFRFGKLCGSLGSGNGRPKFLAKPDIEKARYHRLHDRNNRLARDDLIPHMV